MYPTITLGPLILPTSGLVFIIGAWIVLSIVERVAKGLDLDGESIYGLAALMLAAAFIGARLVFVVSHWSAFQENLLGIVWPLTSGYNFWGGIFFGAFAGFFFGRYKQLAAAPTLDALTPGVLAGLFFISLADFLGGPGYGTQTSLPWGIDVFGIQRHPVQIYELLVALFAVLAWWWAKRKQQAGGQMFLMGMSVYLAGRLLVDAYRANSPLTTNGFHIVQIISLVILLICLYLLSWLVSREPDEGATKAS
jgi:phosphatidylglycerol:prolipoprotein diacylglycerol transferase